MEKNVNILNVLFGVFFLCGVLSAESDQFIYTDSDIKRSGSDQYYLSFKANYEHLGGNYQNAFKTYEKLLRDNPTAQIYGWYAKLLFDTNQFAEVVKLIDETKPIIKDDLNLKLIYAQSFINLDQDKKAEEYLSDLGEKYPKNEQVAYYSIVHDMRQGRLDEALSSIEDFLSRTKQQKKHFLFYFLRSKIYLQKKDTKKAFASIEKSLELFPKFDKGWLFKALLLEQAQNVKGAIEGYKRYLEIVGNDEAIEKQLVHLLFSQKQFPEALEQLKKVKSEHSEYYFDLALLSWKSDKYEEALSYIEKSLAKNKDFQKAKLLKIEVLLALKKSREVLVFMESWLNESPQDQGAVQSLLLLRKAGISVDSIEKVLSNVKNKHPNERLVLFALADIYLEKNEYKKALPCYQEVLKLVDGDLLKSKVQFQIGYIHFALGDKSKSINILEKAADGVHVYPSVYNLLAYSYVEQGDKIEKAANLIEKALKESPQNPYYLDTKGCVLLKLNRNKEAREVFKKALKFAPDDVIIQQHLKGA